MNKITHDMTCSSQIIIAHSSHLKVGSHSTPRLIGQFSRTIITHPAMHTTPSGIKPYGILINQDPTTQIPLHPIAIGGFLGMIIHAFDLVPIGSTDGGRMSQAVLGRVWHLTFSSLVFTVLFLSSLFNDGFNLLLGFLFIYSFTQRDMEMPCRNEIDRVDTGRAVAAFVSWILAALILCPL